MSAPQPPRLPQQSTAGPAGSTNLRVPAGNLSFTEWYSLKFAWFVTKPMPWSVLVQIPLWGFYGYIWIPIWFFISDKRRVQGPTLLTPQQNHNPIAANHPLANRAVPVQPATVRPVRAQPAPIPQRQMVAPPVPTSSNATPSPVLDLNVADEQSVAALPGIGPILAKKMVRTREANGPFESLQQVTQLLGLKPRAIEQLKHRVVVQPPSPTSNTVQNRRGRVIDY